MNHQKLNFEQENNMSITSKNYKKSMENVILSDETGMKLLKQAEERASHHRKGFRPKLAAAILSLAILGALGTGVCYASTGQSPVSLFENLFTNNNDEAIQKASDQFVELNETIYYENLNLNITLEKYVFNREQGIVFTQLKVSAADGSYLLGWEDLYQYIKASGNGVNYKSAEALRKDCMQNPEKMNYYKDMCKHMLEDRLTISEPFWDYSQGLMTCNVENEYTAHIYTMTSTADTKTITSDTVKLKIKDNGDIYSYQLHNPPFTIGEFTLEEAGQLDIRPLDCSSIPYCQSAEVSGGFIRLNFDATKRENWGEKEYPITTLIVKLKNGTQYIYADDDWHDETVIEHREENENIIPIHFGYLDGTHVQNMFAAFPDFLSLDEIESILIEDKECFIK